MSIWTPNLLAVFVLCGLLVPRSVMEVAERIGYEPHVVSFIIGPATYKFGAQLVPGIDFYSQYSVGMPYLFSWFLGESGDAAILSYVRLMVGAMLIFYLGLFCYLRSLLESWRWALSTTITTLLLQFHSERTFFDPSSYVLRYPLLIVTIWATSGWIGRRFDWPSTMLVAAIIGGSLFLNTETGLYQALATTAVGLIYSRGDARRILSSMIPGFGGGAIFIIICYLAFGDAVLSRQYFDGLLQPFVIYGRGFGGVTIDWRYEWHILYNIVAPGMAIVTIVVCTKKIWKNELPASHHAHFAAVMMFSFAGVFMSAKYINMSLIGLWHVNAIGFVVVLAWWGKQIQCLLHECVPLPGHCCSVSCSALFVSALAASALGLVVFANDPRSPDYYGFRAWLKYPALLNLKSTLIPARCRELACSAPRISSLDIDLIRRWSVPGQRIAILGSYDWAYLVSARRASWFHYLPSSAIFTQQQLAAARSPPEILFLPKSFDKNQLDFVHPELARIWSTELRNFKILDEAPNLTAWVKH